MVEMKRKAWILKNSKDAIKNRQLEIKIFEFLNIFNMYFISVLMINYYHK